MKALLINTYELGHQPFGLASPAEWLQREGVDVSCLDLAVEMPSDEKLQAVDLVALYVPMHTATRLAVPVARRVKQVNPDAHLCFYGLYASMNEGLFRDIGAESVIGGEFEEPLIALVRQLADEGRPQQWPADRTTVSLGRQQFLTPDRTKLPGLERYAHLVTATGERKRVGYTEASRGCKHLCRHCPIVPVYGGRFRVVQEEVVLADIANLVKMGAEHITFGDPDFLNGPRHALNVVSGLHDRFPQLTYDVVIKIEHLVKHARHLPTLADTGCLLVTSAVESFDEHVLEILDKQHTKQDVSDAIESLASLGIAVNPTFVAFTPWTTMDSYLDFLETIYNLNLVPNVSPVQYGIRLLIPSGSRILEVPGTDAFLEGFDEEALAYRWSHPDPRMDDLHKGLLDCLQDADDKGTTRADVFNSMAQIAYAAAGRATDAPITTASALPALPPRLDEPWYCCAEPTERQLLHIEGFETGA